MKTNPRTPLEYLRRSCDRVTRMFDKEGRPIPALLPLLRMEVNILVKRALKVWWRFHFTRDYKKLKEGKDEINNQNPTN